MNKKLFFLLLMIAIVKVSSIRGFECSDMDSKSILYPTLVESYSQDVFPGKSKQKYRLMDVRSEITLKDISQFPSLKQQEFVAELFVDPLFKRYLATQACKVRSTSDEKERLRNIFIKGHVLFFNKNGLSAKSPKGINVILKQVCLAKKYDITIFARVLYDALYPREKLSKKLKKFQDFPSISSKEVLQESDLSACEILLTLKKHPAP